MAASKVSDRKTLPFDQVTQPSIFCFNLSTVVPDTTAEREREKRQKPQPLPLTRGRALEYQQHGVRWRSVGMQGGTYLCLCRTTRQAPATPPASLAENGHVSASSCLQTQTATQPPRISVGTVSVNNGTPPVMCAFRTTYKDPSLEVSA